MRGKTNNILTYVSILLFIFLFIIVVPVFGFEIKQGLTQDFNKVFCCNDDFCKILLFQGEQANSIVLQNGYCLNIQNDTYTKLCFYSSKMQYCKTFNLVDCDIISNIFDNKLSILVKCQKRLFT